MLDQVLLELLNQFNEPTMLGDIFGIGMIVSSMIEGGLGAWKMTMGKKMADQAREDRQRYIGEMTDMMKWKMGQHNALRDMVMHGVPGGNNVPTVGDLQYSSLQQGREQVQSELGSYLKTIGNIEAPSNKGFSTWEEKAKEKQKMAQKMKLVKQNTRRIGRGGKPSGPRSKSMLR